MKKFFIGFLIVLIWLLLPFIFYMIGIKATFLNPDFYKKELVKNDTYTQLSGLIVDSITASLGEYAPAEAKLSLAAAFSPDWLKIQAEGVIDATFAMLKYQAQLEDLDLLIDMSEPHRVIEGIIKENIVNQPDFIFSSEDILALNPIPEKIQGLALVQMLAGGGGASINALAEKPSIIDSPELQKLQENLFFMQKIIRWINFFVFGSIGLVLIFILISLLLIKKSLVRIFKMLGNIFFVPGILGVVALLLQKLLFGFYEGDFISNKIGTALGNADLANDLISSMLQSFINFMLWPFSLCAATGLIFIVFAYILNKYRKSAK